MDVKWGKSHRRKGMGWGGGSRVMTPGSQPVLGALESNGKSSSLQKEGSAASLFHLVLQRLV